MLQNTSISTRLKYQAVCSCVLQCILCFFFFFQAEDGIRDYKVTGVQTCALPICLFAKGFGHARQAALVAGGAAEQVDGHDAVLGRSEEHTSELQSPCNLVCRLLLEKKKNNTMYASLAATIHMHLDDTAQPCTQLD